MTIQEVMSNWVVQLAIGFAIGWTVCRVGIPTLYQDIKHFIQGFKGSISAAKTPTVTPTTPKV